MAVAAGSDHSLALLNDGDVAAWGDNSNRQIAIPDRGGRRAIWIAAGDRYSIVLLEDGKLLKCGYSCGQSRLHSKVKTRQAPRGAPRYFRNYMILLGI